MKNLLKEVLKHEVYPAMGCTEPVAVAFAAATAAKLLKGRTTAVLVALFFITSIGLAVLASHQRAPRSLIDQPGTSGPISPTTLPPGPAGPATPAEPSVPLTK